MLRRKIWFKNKIVVQNKITFQVDFLRTATTLTAKRLHFTSIQQIRDQQSIHFLKSKEYNLRMYTHVSTVILPVKILQKASSVKI